MSNPFALVRSVDDHGDHYKALLLWCPGCEYQHEGRKVGGLNHIPFTGDGKKRPTWTWNNDLVRVTIHPSLLVQYTRYDVPFVCHSFLQDGRWQFLGDCTHSLGNQSVPMISLPDWILG